jgi:hypothetical protein
MFFSVWAVGVGTCDAQTLLPKLKVGLIDQVGLVAKARSHAIALATGVLEKAGIRTEWIVCDAKIDCRDELQEASFLIRVVPGRGRRSELGIAYADPESKPAGYATVFYGEATDVATSADCAPSVALAFVMAHEVGHLLGLRHTPEGVMKEHFRADDIAKASRGALVFSAQETKALRDTQRQYLSARTYLKP